MCVCAYAYIYIYVCVYIYTHICMSCCVCEIIYVGIVYIRSYLHLFAVLFDDFRAAAMPDQVVDMFNDWGPQITRESQPGNGKSPRRDNRVTTV